MAAPGSYSVFIGSLGWFYNFPTMKAARTFVAGHEGRRYDIHKGSKLVESGKVHPPTPGTSGRVWLVRNPSRRNPRRPPGYGTIKGAQRQWARQTASHVGGKRSKSRGTHKYFREGFAAADRSEQEAMRKKRQGNPNPKRTLVGHIKPKTGTGRRIAVYEQTSGQLMAGGERYADMRDLLNHIDLRWHFVASNPLPVGRYVTVRAKRLTNGRVELRGIR